MAAYGSCCGCNISRARLRRECKRNSSWGDGKGGGVETKTNEERERPTNGQAEREWTKRMEKRVLGV